MAIDKINSGGLGDNLELPGTEAAKMPIGTTAQRASAAQGDLRFNSTTSLMEYYDGNGWKSIDSAPVVSSISPDNIADTDDDVDITITGNFFSSGATVKAIGSDGSEISAGTVTFTNSTTLVANFDGTSFDDALEDYDIEVTNVSGLSGIGNDLLSVNASPVWTVAAGTLATIYDSARTGISITTGATDDEGASLTYSVSVGSLPAGLSISSSTGTITGTATAVGSDTTSTFTLSVTDGSNTVTRQYSILVKAPVITSYTSTGSGTFTVPSGITSVDVLVVAGGGGAGADEGGGGGAGGLIYHPAFPVTPGGGVSYTVGSGGGNPGQKGQNGQNSVFGGLTAQGGGGGGAGTSQDTSITVGNPGGSGGGCRGGRPGNPYGRPTGTQPAQPGQSGAGYGFGEDGGDVAGPYGMSGGTGGGGAGGQGQDLNPSNSNSNGGVGKQYDISGTQVYYAGGGGGAGYSSVVGGSGGQGGGGDGVGAPQWPSTQNGQAGTANRGGGGGAGSPQSQGSGGGSGIVIVKY